MDLTYELIAVAIIALPFLLTGLLSASSGDTVRVLGAGLGTKDRIRTLEALPVMVRQLLYERRRTQAVALVRKRTGGTEAAAQEMVEAIEKEKKPAKP